MNKLLLLLLFPFTLLSQGEFNQWRFGNGAGLNFNSGNPSVVYSSISSSEAAASVADCYGNLLFYTDGQTVWGSNNSRMDEGYDLDGVGAAYPPTQGALIVKRPNSSSIYYIFTASDIYGVKYSVVNMAANGGAGKVIQKNVKVSSQLSQKLGVTYHQNGEDIWVVTHYEGSNTYESFLVTQTGISPTSVKSSTGPVFTSSHGEIKFNQQGTKVGAVVQDQNLITLADFNNATGVISNAYAIQGAYDSPHGCEFSPSGSKFYVSAWGGNGGVIQFQVSGSNSATLNGTRRRISGSFSPNGSLQLAPNGKIYVAHSPELFSANSWLGVINFPENTGTAAAFDRTGVNLGSASSTWQLSNVTLTNNNIPVPKDIVAQNFCFQDETSFGLTNETGVVDILWDFDDPSSGVNNFSSMLSPEHIFSSPGTYTIKVTITNVCDIEEYNHVVEIIEGPKSNLDSLNVCQFTPTSIGFSPEIGVDYKWIPSQGLSSATSSNPVFNSAGLSGDKFVYDLTSTSAEGCVFYDTLVINLYDIEKAGEDQYMCPGFGVELGVDSGVVNALWTGSNINDPNSLIPTVTPVLTTEYYVELTDTNGCVSKDTVLVEVNPIVPVNAGDIGAICFGDSILIGEDISPDRTVFSWSDPNFVENEDQPITSAFPQTSQWFYLLASIDTCSTLDSVFVAVNSLPNVQIQPEDTIVCYDDSVYYTGTGAKEYTWYSYGKISSYDSLNMVVGYNTTDIVLIGVDSNGCVNSDTTSLEVLPLPEIMISNDTAICIGQEATLSVSGGADYLWLNNELLGETETSQNIKPAETKTYKVKVTGLNGCYDVANVEVIVNSLPVVNLMSDTLICKESDAYLWATGGNVYQWSPADYLNQTNIANPISKPDAPILYQVIVIDENGCIDSAETSISLNDNPEAAFDFDYIPSCAGFEVQFRDSSVLVDTYIWDFGNGNTSSEKNPFVIFEFGTQASSNLIVGNNGICFDTASVNFNWKKISEFIDVFVPNIITPNSDGKNDCFEVILPDEFVDCADYEIFNRWGMKVYDSKEFKTDFCGFNAYNNQELSEGTYYYTLLIGDYQLNGFVTIVR